MVTLGRGHRRNQTPPQESNCHLLFLNNSLGSPEAKWKIGAHLLISLASFTVVVCTCSHWCWFLRGKQMDVFFFTAYPQRKLDS